MFNLHLDYHGKAQIVLQMLRMFFSGATSWIQNLHNIPENWRKVLLPKPGSGQELMGLLKGNPAALKMHNCLLTMTSVS